VFFSGLTLPAPTLTIEPQGPLTTARGCKVFCRNCAFEMDLISDVCVRCGEPRGKGDAFCPFCAAPSPADGIECAVCGAPLRAMVTVEQRSRRTAALMGIFLGVFGFHNFYLGYIGKATAQLLMTCLSLVLLTVCLVYGLFITGLCFGLLLPVTWVWSLAEAVAILRGKADRDAFGNPLRE